MLVLPMVVRQSRPATSPKARVASDAVPRALSRDQLIALMVAERDVELHGRGAVRDVQWPDEDNRMARAVDLRGVDDVGAFVVEHTRIESYESQIDDRMAVSKIFPKFGPEIPDRWEAGYMRLSVAPGEMARVSYGNRARVASVLTEWVASKIDEVPQPHVPGSSGAIVGQHPDVPFRWALWQALPFDAAVLVGPNARVVQISFAKPVDLEEQRIVRLRRALDEKVPKLVGSAGDSCRSILVIEDRDTVFSAPAFVSRALEQASYGRALPDVIYLLDTGRGNPQMLAVYEAGVWAHSGDGGYDWKGFSAARSSELNLMPTNWA